MARRSGSRTGAAGAQPTFILSNAASRLDDVAQQTFIGTCAEQANFAFAVAEALKGGTPAGLTEQQQKLLLEAVEALSNAKRPLIISGSSNGSIEMVQAAANIARALSGDEPSHLALMLPEANTMGLELLIPGTGVGCCTEALCQW